MSTSFWQQVLGSLTFSLVYLKCFLDAQMTLIQFELFSFCPVSFLPNKAHGMNTQVGGGTHRGCMMVVHDTIYYGPTVGSTWSHVMSSNWSVLGGKTHRTLYLMKNMRILKEWNICNGPTPERIWFRETCVAREQCYIMRHLEDPGVG